MMTFPSTLHQSINQSRGGSHCVTYIQSLLFFAFKVQYLFGFLPLQLDARVICLRNRKGEFSLSLCLSPSLSKQTTQPTFFGILNQMLSAVIIIQRYISKIIALQYQTTVYVVHTLLPKADAAVCLLGTFCATKSRRHCLSIKNRFGTETRVIGPTCLSSLSTV